MTSASSTAVPVHTGSVPQSSLESNGRHADRVVHILFRVNPSSLTLDTLSIFSSPSSYYGLLLWFPEYFKYIENCNFERNHNCSINPSHPEHSCSPSGEACNMTRSGREDEIYLDSLYVALAGIPGTLLGILTVNIVGAKAMLGWSVLGCWKSATSSLSFPVSVFSLVVSGVSSLLIWVIPDQNKTEDVVVILSSVFGGVSIIGWNAVDVISTSELFPVHLRSVVWNNSWNGGRNIFSWGRVVLVA